MRAEPPTVRKRGLLPLSAPAPAVTRNEVQWHGGSHQQVVLVYKNVMRSYNARFTSCWQTLCCGLLLEPGQN